MSKYHIDGNTLTAIADAIRNISGSSDGMTTDEMITSCDDTSSAIQEIVSILAEKGADVSSYSGIADLPGIIAAMSGSGATNAELATGSITPSEATKTITVIHGLGRIPHWFCMMRTVYLGVNGSANATVAFPATAKQTLVGIVLAEGRCIAVIPSYSAGYKADMYIAKEGATSFYYISDINEQTITFDISAISSGVFVADKYMWEAF